MSWDKSKGVPEPVRALDRIKELENHEPLAPLVGASPRIVIHRESVIPYLRERCVEKLVSAAESLPNGWNMGVTDAWRPFARQVRIYEAMTKWALEYKPDMTHAQLKRLVNRWVAPIDRKTPPGHCTGAAVDLVLLTSDGVVVDTTSPFDRLSGAPTFSYGLTEESRANRMILFEAMTQAGFSNCRDEWWHYSYGDAGWAVRTRQTTCMYGLIELDEQFYAEQERTWVKLFKTRNNPFFPEPKQAG